MGMGLYRLSIVLPLYSSHSQLKGPGFRTLHRPGRSQVVRIWPMGVVNIWKGVLTVYGGPYAPRVAQVLCINVYPSFVLVSRIVGSTRYEAVSVPDILELRTYGIIISEREAVSPTDATELAPLSVPLSSLGGSRSTRNTE